MTSNFSENNQTLGRGEIHFAAYLPRTTTPGGFRYVGNTPSFSVALRPQSLDHLSSDHGIRVKDKSVTLQTDYTSTLVMDDIQPENLAMLFLGTCETVAIDSSKLEQETFSGVVGNLSLQLGLSDSNPAGIRNISSVSVLGDGVELSPYLQYRADFTRGIITPLSSYNLLVVTYNIDQYKEDRIISGTQSAVGAMKFIAFNPQGDQVDYFMPYVRINPSGDFSLKADTWQQLSFSVDILTGKNTASIYATRSPVGPPIWEELPDGMTVNGGVYMTENTTLPDGLTENGGVVMTDGRTAYRNTAGNGGVLCTTQE